MQRRVHCVPELVPCIHRAQYRILRLAPIGMRHPRIQHVTARSQHSHSHSTVTVTQSQHGHSHTVTAPIGMQQTRTPWGACGTGVGLRDTREMARIKPKSRIPGRHRRAWRCRTCPASDRLRRAIGMDQVGGGSGTAPISVGDNINAVLGGRTCHAAWQGWQCRGAAEKKGGGAGTGLFPPPSCASGATPTIYLKFRAAAPGHLRPDPTGPTFFSVLSETTMTIEITSAAPRRHSDNQKRSSSRIEMLSTPRVAHPYRPIGTLKTCFPSRLCRYLRQMRETEARVTTVCK